MKPWHDGAHECDEDTFRAFVAWAGQQTKLDRHIAEVVEPPFEMFVDLTVAVAEGEMPDIVCGATLMHEWPSLGIVDPRPEDKRPTSWWRASCKVRKDWWERYSAAQGGSS